MTEATVIPPIYELVIPQRATLRETFELPFDGQGKTVEAQIWTSYERTRLICDLQVEVIQQSPTLIVDVIANWEDLAGVSGSGVWDLAVNNADGTRDHWLKGPAYVDRRAT
jgi:hypothetical protein